jgi:hypothetical protein
MAGRQEAGGPGHAPHTQARSEFWWRTWAAPYPKRRPAPRERACTSVFSTERPVGRRPPQEVFHVQEEEPRRHRHRRGRRHRRIGGILSKRLAEKAYRVVVADADEGAAQRVVGELSALGHGKHHWFVGDLTTTGVNRRLVEEATAYGTPAVLVNAVGISPKDNGRKRPFFDV